MMTVRQLRDRLSELVDAGDGDLPVAYEPDDGTSIRSVSIGSSVFLQRVVYLNEGVGTVIERRKKLQQKKRAAERAAELQRSRS